MLIRDQMNMNIFNSAEQSRGYPYRKRCYGVFFLGDLQKSPERGSGQLALGAPA